jgi:hypothetical protein
MHRKRGRRPERPRVISGVLVAIVAALGIAGCSNSGSAAGTSTTTATTPTTATTATTTPTTTSTTAAPTGPAEQLYVKALASVSHASSVHYVATSDGTSSGSKTTLRFVADVGVSDGKLVATWSGDNEKGKFTIIVVGAATYLQADAPTLATFFEAMPATDAATYAGKWISFSSGDKLYTSLRDDTTLPSVSTSLKFHPTTEQSASGGGIVINGLPLSSSAAPKGEKASTTMTISSTTDLPEAQKFSATDSGASDTSSISFSQWNSAAAASAPSGSISTWDSIVKAITPTTTAAG